MSRLTSGSVIRLLLPVGAARGEPSDDEVVEEEEGAEEVAQGREVGIEAQGLGASFSSLRAEAKERLENCVIQRKQQNSNCRDKFSPSSAAAAVAAKLQIQQLKQVRICLSLSPSYTNRWRYALLDPFHCTSSLCRYPAAIWCNLRNFVVILLLLWIFLFIFCFFFELRVLEMRVERGWREWATEGRVFVTRGSNRPWPTPAGNHSGPKNKKSQFSPALSSASTSSTSRYCNVRFVFDSDPDPDAVVEAPLGELWSIFCSVVNCWFAKFMASVTLREGYSSCSAWDGRGELVVCKELSRKGFRPQWCERWRWWNDTGDRADLDGDYRVSQCLVSVITCDYGGEIQRVNER